MIFLVALSILVLVSLVGNTLVILTVLINKPMQTTLNYLLVNLAAADMTFALFIGIQYVITPFVAHHEGQVGQYLCIFATKGIIAWIGGAVSILCLVYIAVERYFGIVHPLRQRGRFTRRRLKIFVVTGWSFAITINIPEFLGCKGVGYLDYTYIPSKVDSLVWMILAGIVPVSIMGYLYSRVVHHLWFKPVENLEASQRAALRYRKQVTITLITVSVIYAVSWFPNLTDYVIAEFWYGLVAGSWFDKIGILLLTFNSCVNPVLYSMRMKGFREHLRDMLLGKKKQRARGQAAVVHIGPTTGQPTNGSEESVLNTAEPTPFSFTFPFKQQMMFTRKASLNIVKSRRSSITSRTTVKTGNIETITWARVSKSKRATESVGNSSTGLQRIMKPEQSSGALAGIGTNGSQETGDNTDTRL